MLAVVVFLVVLWLILQLLHVTLGGLIYVLLIIALAVFVYDLLIERRGPRI